MILTKSEDFNRRKVFGGFYRSQYRTGPDRLFKTNQTATIVMFNDLIQGFCSNNKHDWFKEQKVSVIVAHSRGQNRVFFTRKNVRASVIWKKFTREKPAVSTHKMLRYIWAVLYNLYISLNLTRFSLLFIGLYLRYWLVEQ